MNAEFFDIHHHILFGMDDGPRDEQAMFAMLRAAAADGITRIVATPHAEPGIRPFHRRMLRAAMARAQAYCRNEGLSLMLYDGAEILYTDHTCRLLADGRIPTLAGTNRVLVEFLPDVEFSALERALEQLLAGGYRPVIAHVERYDCLVRRPIRAQMLKREMPVFFQMNGRTLERGTFLQKRFAARLLDQRLLDAVATDAHNTTGRNVCMTRAYQALCARSGEACARKLTDGHVLGLSAPKDTLDTLH